MASVIDMPAQTCLYIDLATGPTRNQKQPNGASVDRVPGCGAGPVMVHINHLPGPFSIHAEYMAEPTVQCTAERRLKALDVGPLWGPGSHISPTA
jgi:hypothetical protein